MSILIGWAAKLVGERFAPLLAYGFVLLLLVGALWWLRADAYSDGVRDTDDKWEEAGRLLAEQAEQAAGKADEASADRVADYQEQLAEEKEKLDEADAAGTSPLDVLFGT